MQNRQLWSIVFWTKLDHGQLVAVGHWFSKFQGRFNWSKFLAHIILAESMTAKSRNVLKAGFKNKLVWTASPGGIFKKIEIGFAMLFDGGIKDSMWTAV
jgi:hypothetical protein